MLHRTPMYKAKSLSLSLTFNNSFYQYTKSGNIYTYIKVQ